MSAIPSTMTAIEIGTHSDKHALALTTRPVPIPAMGEVLIRVEAAGLNRADVLQRKGHYPPPPGASDIPGMEVAGTIVDCALGVHNVDRGEAVCALVAGGGYAEYVTAPAQQCLPIPDGLSMVEAASLPEACFTVWTNIVDRGRLKSGDILLVHGGSSGIGSAAIQIGKALGARVFATAGSYEKTHFCEALGAERAFNYKIDDFVKSLKEFTHGHGADVILDMVGRDYVARNFSAAAMDGRIVNIAYSKGSRIEIDLSPIMTKRLYLTGSTLRSRNAAEKAAIAAAVKAEIWPMFATGTLKPTVHGTFPLAEAQQAQDLMESSAHMGKIVLTVA